MNIVEFYKKGARVTVDEPAVDNHSTFGASTSGGVVDIGYVPTAKAKPVEGYAWDVVVHNGEQLLVLKGGSVYDVVLAVGDKEKSDTISALGGHLAIPVPASHEVVSVAPVVESPVQESD